MGVPDDSPLRNPKQIPFPTHPPLVQSQPGTDEEDTPSMRELVHEIDTHVQLIDLEVNNNLNAVLPSTQPVEDVQAQLLTTDQPIEDAPAHPVEDATPSQFADSAAQVWRNRLPYRTSLLFLFFFSIIYFPFIWFCLWSPGCGDKTLVKF